MTTQEIIWQVVALIPPGRVATYGQVARMAGYPHHARYVGRILSQLPAHSNLPWHRVINAQGRPSLAVDSDAYWQQRFRLQAEGVEFKEGRVSLGSYGLDSQELSPWE